MGVSGPPVPPVAGDDVTSKRRSWSGRAGVAVACACAGLLGATSLVNAQGTDLRPGRYTDLLGLVGEQRAQVQDLRRQSRALQQRVDALTASMAGTAARSLQRRIDRLDIAAGLRGLAGPGLVVTLNDAPRGERVPPGTDPNLLVVHQQDLQAVINALWAGSAEGISLQGQRIISTTGVKCVGNTVVLQGVPYSPPYRIVAVGNPRSMYTALLASPEVQNYRDYVRPPYNLGWSLRLKSRLSVPAYSGPLTMQYAAPAPSSATSGPGG
jgi:uncharacterized protein YlxW (UPF0749 family)